MYNFDQQLYNMDIVVAFFLAVSLSFSGFSSAEQWFDVTTYGAVGNGKTDNAKAFQDAWKALCQKTSDQSVGLHIPVGKTFLLGPVTFEGPCKPRLIKFMLNGTLLAPKRTWQGDIESWIEFKNVDGLDLHGGKIDGQGAVWWNTCAGMDDPSKCDRPTALKFQKCNGLKVSGLESANSPRNHISVSTCKNAQLSKLKLTAPEDSPNTDGIDVSNSDHIEIFDSVMATGDDCIAINDRTSQVTISGIICGPGHGISIGSLGKDGDFAVVDGIIVKNCTFIGTDNCARIKTWQGGSGYARNINYQNIKLDGVRNPIFIDQFYCPHKTCATQEKAVAISDVLFSGIEGTAMDPEAITLNCSSSVPCKNIKLMNVQITRKIIGAGGSETDEYAIANNAYGTSKNTFPPVDLK